MFGIGPTELILVFLIVFLLFGAKKLPELAKGLGKAIKEFKNAAKEIETSTQMEEPQIKEINNPHEPGRIIDIKKEKHEEKTKQE